MAPGSGGWPEVVTRRPERSTPAPAAARPGCAVTRRQPRSRGARSPVFSVTAAWGRRSEGKQKTSHNVSRGRCDVLISKSPRGLGSQKRRSPRSAGRCGVPRGAGQGAARRKCPPTRLPAHPAPPRPAPPALTPTPWRPRGRFRGAAGGGPGIEGRCAPSATARAPLRSPGVRPLCRPSRGWKVAGGPPGLGAALGHGHEPAGGRRGPRVVRAVRGAAPGGGACAPREGRDLPEVPQPLDGQRPHAAPGATAVLVRAASEETERAEAAQGPGPPGRPPPPPRAPPCGPAAPPPRLGPGPPDEARRRGAAPRARGAEPDDVRPGLAT